MCTDFLVATEDASAVVVGRSMEFGIDLGSKFRFHAKGHTVQSPGSLTHLHGLKWTTKFDYVGLTVTLYGVTVIGDAMNSEGLSAGALWMPSSTYPQAAKDPSRGLAPELFVEWAVGNFATVDAVKEALANGDAELWHSDWMSSKIPLHFALHDAKGNSMVVEFTDRQMFLYASAGHDNSPLNMHNPVAVLTNHPTFPEHLENLRNYAGLSSRGATPVKLGTGTFAPHGCGSGLFGIPGDSTPPSRFVRAVYLREFSEKPKNAAEARSLALHLLNTVDIPYGTSRDLNEVTGKDSLDYTQWVVVKDLTNRTFGVRTYDSLGLQTLDLRTVDFKKADGKTLALSPVDSQLDANKQLAS
ncbi:linear amide C-N hydrolase [Myxococcus sp. MxC21-1]|uniref:linear amide C-N hydrolase n=1 Tax=Myxococcus sp. MxC21-1 TaxID=3041439 RepID=UPI002931CF3B|nr:linear amide C-N hydrolase [Myxococcus sp. MxC21-1]WNZ60152.1 linear amide C-N hydrolase [Myxococcus sp. MxC21-1]